MTSADTLTVRTLDAVDIRLELAGLGSRSYAYAIDWHIRVAAALVWFLLLGLLADGLGMAGLDLDDEWLSTRLLLSGWPALMIYALYHPVLEVWLKGRTPGKRIAGIRIVDGEGGVPGAGALLTRNLFRLLDSLPVFYGLGILCMLFTRRQLRLGDMASGTLLIHDHRDRKATPVSSAHMNGPFSIGQLDVAEELLGRWQELESSARYTLARQLLAASPVPEVSHLAESLSDDQLQSNIERLIAAPGIAAGRSSR